MRWIALVCVSMGLAGCTSYDLAFRCQEPSQDATCPMDQDCPALPLGAGGCEDLPALFEHPAITAEVGRPLGCVARLPYENPFYPGSQQVCICSTRPVADSEGRVVEKTDWGCPL
jgi:hypothetical protein